MHEALLGVADPSALDGELRQSRYALLAQRMLAKDRQRLLGLGAIGLLE